MDGVIITYKRGLFDVPGNRKPVVDLHTHSWCAQEVLTFCQHMDY